MCGRVFVKTSVAGLMRTFTFVRREEDDGLDDLPPRYNGAPGQDYPLIIAESDVPGAVFMAARWGRIPSCMKTPAKGRRQTINAMSETVAEKPMFRAAYRSRRALMPIDGFFEWVRHEVVCVIVRRSHPAGPAVPSAVPYEVGRRGNKPSKSPRTTYPAVFGRLPNPQGRGRSASIRRIRARVDGMVSICESPKVPSRTKGA